MRLNALLNILDHDQFLKAYWNIPYVTENSRESYPNYIHFNQGIINAIEELIYVMRKSFFFYKRSSLNYTNGASTQRFSEKDLDNLVSTHRHIFEREMIKSVFYSYLRQLPGSNIMDYVGKDYIDISFLDKIAEETTFVKYSETKCLSHLMEIIIVLDKRNNAFFL